jgi:L-lactate dehydrogenase (cytochrome)
MTIANVADFRELARRRLPNVLFEYIDGGSYSETTLRRNVADLETIALRQRVMVDMSALDLSTTAMGQPLSMPVGLAPVGLAGMYARRGETQAARAAKAAGVPFCLSSMAVCDMAEVAGHITPWFQLYMLKDRGFMRTLLDKAQSLGVEVLVFTVDLPLGGARYRDIRSGFTGGEGIGRDIRRAIDGLSHPAWMWDVWLHGRPHTLGNIAAAMEGGNTKDMMGWTKDNFDRSVTWVDIEWVRQTWKGKIVIKGVLDPDDAREARRCGADGLVVSNHGGRQLDGAKSSIAALPRISDAVGADLEVFMDGGVRSGLDVLKALALGAKACFIGRAWAYALGARGERGVAQMLEILRAELTVAMVLTGCRSVKEAGAHLLDA